MDCCDGRNSHEPENRPQVTGCQEPAHCGNATDCELHQNTKTGTPSPAANASDAQLPEPKPAKHLAAKGDGTRPTGQGEPTNPTNPRGDGERATAETSEAERRANEPRPTPKPDARNTHADGTASRTKASAPDAHPTLTGNRFATCTATPETSG